MEFQLEVLEILKVMLLKCYIQYASKCGKCSSGHRTGNWKKSVFIPIPKNAMPKNVSTTIQLRSFYMLENTQNLSSEVSAVYELRPSRCITWVLKSQRKVLLLTGCETRKKGASLRVEGLGLPWGFRWWRICRQCRRSGFDSWFGKIPWRKEWLPTSGFLPGQFHGQRSPAGTVRGAAKSRTRRSD